MRFAFIAAIALLAVLVLSGCAQQVQGDSAQTPAIPIAFASAEPPNYSKEDLCRLYNSDFNYTNWEIKMNTETQKYSCLLSKEVCRREETPSAIYKYCSDVAYRFYFSE